MGTATDTPEKCIQKILLAGRTHLSIWDIDDTLVTHKKGKMVIRVVKKGTHEYLKRNGKLVTMTTAEFADSATQKKIVGKDGWLIDPESYSDFRNSDIFAKHATPIKENVEKAVAEYKKKNTFFIMLTARGNMFDPGKTGINDKPNLFLNYFKSHGLNMSAPNAHILRAGSMSPLSGGAAKRQIIQKILEAVPFIESVDFYDDAKENVDAFRKIKFKNRKIDMVATQIESTEKDANV